MIVLSNLNCLIETFVLKWKVRKDQNNTNHSRSFLFRSDDLAATCHYYTSYCYWIDCWWSRENSREKPWRCAVMKTSIEMHKKVSWWWLGGGLVVSNADPRILLMYVLLMLHVIHFDWSKFSLFLKFSYSCEIVIILFRIHQPLNRQM